MRPSVIHTGLVPSTEWFNITPYPPFSSPGYSLRLKTRHYGVYIYLPTRNKIRGVLRRVQKDVGEHLFGEAHRGIRGLLLHRPKPPLHALVKRIEADYFKPV